ncbi:ornithine aminotransferase [Dorcoceras hygrometricum]|uniref:Ornithine aminotransferase n=1 Tax=Dorcoceras hygrometricum TaxID=472368 RepID=A0A2Z7CA82_9LAMI|nr:ornithine aminotransferase [Dorcoceras hygrometricum]
MHRLDQRRNIAGCLMRRRAWNSGHHRAWSVGLKRDQCATPPHPAVRNFAQASRKPWPATCDNRTWSSSHESAAVRNGCAAPSRGFACTLACISEKPGSDTTIGDPDPPLGEAAEEHRINSRETIRILLVELAGNNFPAREAAAAYERKGRRPTSTRRSAWTGQRPGSNDEHSVHLHHRDFIVIPIADQIGRIDSVSKTEYYDLKNRFSEPQCKMTVLPLNSGKPRTCVTLNGSGIQLAVGPQPLRLRNHNSGLAQRIMVKRLATSPHDPLGITDSACKNQLVVVSVQYGPFNPYIPIRSTTIDSIGYPRMSASGESSTTMHRLLHASGSHPIPTPCDPK